MRREPRLRELRRGRSLTIEGLAERAAVPRSTYDAWECYGVPETVAYAVRIADALGVGVRDLFDA